MAKFKKYPGKLETFIITNPQKNVNQLILLIFLPNQKKNAYKKPSHLSKEQIITQKLQLLPKQ